MFTTRPPTQRAASPKSEMLPYVWVYVLLRIRFFPFYVDFVRCDEDISKYITNMEKNSRSPSHDGCYIPQLQE